MKKIEVYEDSNKVLHRDEDSYITAESKILHEQFVQLHSVWLQAVKNDPTNHYKFLKYIKDLIEKTEDFEEQYKEKIDFFTKAKKIRSKDYHYDSAYENSNWNDSPGEWRGISAQDLGIPNC